MERFRVTRRPLGRIIAEVYEERENVWWNQSVSVGGDSTPGILSLPSQVNSLQQAKNRRFSVAGRNVIIYKQQRCRNQVSVDGIIRCTRSGWRKLCEAFQSGKCRTKGKRCDAGLHKCGGVMPGSNTKVCGLTNHGGHKCGRCRRA